MAGPLPNLKLQCMKCGIWHWLRVALLLGSISIASRTLSAQELDLRLWIAWGGGAARQWQGEVRIAPSTDVSAPTIVRFQPIGLSPDEPGSIHVAGNRLVIEPRTPRSYDAVNLQLTAGKTASLEITLTPDNQTNAVRQVHIPLEQLVSEIHTSLLDERGNRLLVRRSPGDDMRVRFDREDLVFSPGETFEFRLDPHLLGLEADDALVYHAELRRNGSEDVDWEDSRNLRADANGEPPESGAFQVPMPVDEGVYDLWLSVSRRRLPTRFSPTKMLRERNLQLVVLSPEATAESQGSWREVHAMQAVPDETSSPASSPTAKIWNSLPKLPQWKWIPGVDAGESTKPVGNGLSNAVKHLGQDFVQLSPGGWQAYPLAVGKAGLPYAVEIEFPSNVPQTLGVSVLEANSAGRVSPIGPGFGVDVPAENGNAKPTLQRHRLVFWPKTEKPVLLLSNRRQNEAAVYGKIRILGGLRQLPAQSAPRRADGRLLALYFDQPLIAENFSAQDCLDELTGRSLKDWRTFLQAGTRLSQYVKYAGSNGAMVSVLHEGGTIYPSQLLQATPKYDNGVFFGTGQDPMQKDALELLFRIFDREGLTLVPALQFATPLPELEDLLRRSAAAAAAAAQPRVGEPTLAPPMDRAKGILMHRTDGSAWRTSHGADQAVGPYYNPLAPEVQLAVRRVVIELVQKYSGHPSFGGVAVQLGPKTYMQFPNAAWGIDPVTLARFAQDEGLVAAGDQGLAAYVTGEGRRRWLNWRAGELADFYQKIADDVSGHALGAKLYFAGANMLNDAELQSRLRPRLPENFDPQEAMLAVGIDPRLLCESTNVVLLRPYRLAPSTPLDQQAVNHSLRHSTELDAIFGDRVPPPGSDDHALLRPLTGSLLYHEPQVTPISSFQQRSPFGADNTPDWLLTHISAHGPQGRQWFIHSLATLDCQEVFTGGWLGAIGQNEPMADIIDVFRQLPAKRFATVHPARVAGPTPPLTVRQLQHGGRTYVYAINDTPWPVTASLDLAGVGNGALEVLGQQPAGATLPPIYAQGTQSTRTWSVSLAPWDMTAAVLDSSAAKVVDWKADVSREALAELRAEVDNLRSRANRLRDPRPLTVLTNPDFESPITDGVLPGWEYSRGADISVQVDSRQSRGGRNSLHIRSDGPVTWVRSNPFQAPSTGRLSVWIWLKIEDEDAQPPLQLAIEGRLDGEAYYRPARVGASDRRGGPIPPALSNDWAPYLVRIDHLPTSGLTDLRVAVDLMGKGEVWVDDVQVFDLWFDKTERSELLKTVALASLQLGKGDVTQCGRMLGGFWPQFLREHVPLEDVQLADSANSTAGDERNSDGENPDEEEPAAETSWLQRMVPRTPRIPTWFR